MNDNDSRRQEIMRELAVRFKSSSDVMRLIAQRIGEAAQCHNANRRKLERAELALRKSIDPEGDSTPFSYREFVEFSSASEFEHFRKVDPINDDDIENVDWDELTKGLFEEE